MTALRTTILATAAVFLAGAGLASANSSQSPAPPAVGSAWGNNGPYGTVTPYQPGTVLQPATHQTADASSPAGGARADTCFVDQPVYNRAGAVIGHHTVDICAQ